MGWAIYVVGALVLTGLSPVLAKAGSKKTDQTLVAGLFTFVFFVMAVLGMIQAGSFSQIAAIRPLTWIAIAIAGITKGLSLLFVFSALKRNQVSRVSPVYLCQIIALFVLEGLLFREVPGVVTIVKLVLLFIGTILMAKRDGSGGDRSWLVYALLSVVCGAASTFAGKHYISGVESHLSLALITTIAFLTIFVKMLWKKELRKIRSLAFVDGVFILLSAGAVAATNWCRDYAYFLQAGKYIEMTEHLAIVVAVMLSATFLKERLSTKNIVGLVLIVFAFFLPYFLAGGNYAIWNL